ncbi:MAG: beta-ketoacyl-ACP synthase III [Planctomycetota bacterium]
MASGYSEQASPATATSDGLSCRRVDSVMSSPAARYRVSGRGPLAVLTGIQLLGTGVYLPRRVVSNEDLAELGCDAEWIIQRTGIRQRRHAAAEEATSDLVYEAAVRCLDNAGVSSRDVDLILVATMTPDTLTPSVACTIQRRLGAVAPAMDINAACSGFVYAMVTAMQFVKTGCSRRALVVGSDVMSRIVDPADKKTYPLFGDGAGAVLLGAGDEAQGFLSYSLGSEGDFGELLSIPGGGSREPLTPGSLEKGLQYLRMDGRAVFKWAVRMINDIANDVVRHAQLTIEDIDLVIMHQANLRIIDAAVDGLGVDRDKVVVNLDRYGNTTAASVPLVLEEAVAAGRLRRGDHALLMGFGAGLSWGAGVFRY